MKIYFQLYERLFFKQILKNIIIKYKITYSHYMC
jgi:hypothetical protein